MPIISRNQLLSHSSSLACLSYDRVMDVQNDFRRPVSKRVTGDSVVVPTNIKSCVFLQMLPATSMSQVDMSSIALPWYWPAISHMTKLEKTHHLSSWIFLRANISSSILVMPLCPTLMNMLVMSPCCPYLIPRVDSLDAGLLEESWLQDAHQVVELNATFSNHMISNNDEWMGIPKLQWKSTIDAEIGHAHDHESSGVCKSWQGFTNFMRLSLHAL